MGKRLENAKALYLEGIRDGNYVEAIHKYAGERYTQHSTPVKDGKEGFIEFFADFVQRNPERDIEIVRGFEDGQYVFLHAVQHLNGGESRWVTADIFDTDDQGRMIEHWDIIGEWVEETGTPHTLIDGPTEIADLDRTAANKDVVTAYITNVLVAGSVDTLTDYVSSEEYIEHNPNRRGDLDIGPTMRYQDLHRVIGCGNFVAALSEVRASSIDLAVIDLYRLQNGRIVEHWDVIEEIPPRDQWVNSGKF